MIPKWEPRARMGLYVGCSPSHAANVALIFNPCTGHISPQFHVIFDDDFTTVPYLRTATIPPYWADLVRASSNLSALPQKCLRMHKCVFVRTDAYEYASDH